MANSAKGQKKPSKTSPSADSGASARLSASLVGEMQPGQQSELIIGTLVLVAFVASMASYTFSATTLTLCLTLLFGGFLGLIVVNRMFQAWRRPESTTQLTVQVSEGTYQLSAMVQGSDVLAMAIQREIMGRKSLPVADGIVDPARIDDIGAITAFSENEKKAAAVELGADLQKHDEENLARFRSADIQLADTVLQSGANEQLGKGHG